MHYLGHLLSLNRSTYRSFHLSHGSTTQADLTKNRLVRAGKLTNALADEGVRWQQTADTIQQQTNLLVGDVFLSSACIAYYGAFTGAYRSGSQLIRHISPSPNLSLSTSHLSLT